MKQLYLPLFLLASFFAGAQCAIIPLDLDQRIQNSDATVEATVLNSQSFRSGDDGFIHTRWTLDISRVFKGNAASQIQIITLGGNMGSDVHRASHGLKLKPGMAGVFHLNETATPNVFKPYANLQGFIKYDPIGRVAYHPGGSYDSWSEVHAAVENITGRQAIVIGNLPDRYTQINGAMKSITTFSPAALNAGVGDILTITGSNFGNTRGNGNVFFRDANDGGATLGVVPVPEQYISWSDTQIVLEVPTGAGTGTFAVQNNSGMNFFTTNALEVIYNHTNIVYDPDNDTIDNAFETQHYDNDGNGGFSFRYNTEFVNTPMSPSSPDATAEANMDEILDRWKCSSGINFTRGADTTIDIDPNTTGDSENVVRFDNGTELGGGGTLAYALSRYFACSSGGVIELYVEEVDIVMNDDYTWHYGDVSTISPGEFDFYSVMLHEIGHALQLGHVIDTQKVMHFSIGAAQTNRDLAESDFEGSLYVANKSIETVVCGNPLMARGSCSFVYDNSEWTPFNPEGTVNIDNDYLVQNGATSFDSNIIGQDFTVSAGANYSQNNNSTLRLYGNLENNGLLTLDNLSLLGNSSQNVSGTSPFTVTNMEMENLAGVTLNNEVSIEELLQVNGGLLTTNGNLILINSDTHEAIVGPMTLAGADISGDVEVQRFYPANRAYRFIGPSVSTSTPILNNWQESKTFTPGLGTHISGSTSGANGFDATQTGNASLFTYDNTGTNGWLPIGNTDSNTLSAGEAYRLYVRGDRDPSHLISNSTSDTRLRATGSLATGDQNFSNLSVSAGGYSFIGNPYHAPVDMELVMSRSLNLTPNLYFWDPNLGANGAYVTINSATGSSSNNASDANKFAQVQQAFFVETASSGAAEIRFRESDKNILEGGTITFDLPFNAHINATLEKPLNHEEDNTTLDGFALYFSENAEENLAGKRENPGENIYMNINGRNSSLWERATPEAGEVIPLETSNLRAGEYHLRFTLSGISEKVYLIDRLSGEEYEIVDGTVTDIPFQMGEAMANKKSFALRFGEAPELVTTTIDHLSLYPNPSVANEISIAGIQHGHATISVYGMKGNLIRQEEIQKENGVISLGGLNSLARGVYLLEVKDGAEIQTLKMVRK